MTKKALLTILAGGAMLLACEQQEQTADEPVLSVKVQTVGTADRDVVSTFTGSLEGERQAVLYAKLAESIDSVWVEEGDAVEANQVILSLDRLGASTGYRESEATFRNAEKSYGKMKYLYERGAVSESEFDAAETAHDVAQANFQAVRRLVEIQTPIAGVVTSIDHSTGDFVAVGTELATVATKDRLRVRFGVNPTDIGVFRVGGAVKIVSDVVSSVGTGHIVSVASSADPQTRTFQVEALLDNSERKFSPGMFVRINYVRQSLEEAVVVPRESIIVLDRQPSAFVVVDGRAFRKAVTLGPELPGEVVITNGLAVGDTLVTLGQDYLDDSMKVNITEVNGLNQ